MQITAMGNQQRIPKNELIILSLILSLNVLSIKFPIKYAPTIKIIHHKIVNNTTIIIIFKMRENQFL